VLALAQFFYSNLKKRYKMADINKESGESKNLADENDQIKGSNTVKNPDEWTTGDEPMTGAQQSYLKTLSDEAGEEFDETLSKAEASKRIDELQHKTGRGLK